MMAAPMAVTLILVAMHGYLGTHVVRRGVIFVDIALAQIAAFGVAIALLLGSDVGTDKAFIVGLASTFIGALLLSRTRTHDARIPQEAYIGIIYVVFSAAMILILTGIPHGGDEIDHLLVGAILWVTWPVVIKTAVLYGILGAGLVCMHRSLTLISEDSAAARSRGLSLRTWDFLFYMVLGTVVTSSVQIAGVLLVFTLLVVPSVMAIRLLERSHHRFLYILGIGVVAVVTGSGASYIFDLPTGAAIVCTFGLFLGVQVIMEIILRR
ncbi:MAG: metal ABC transporter permease [Candidatus Eisenbacteria bacterium]|uniref:Metal ABC transporter permease n=1 Tax=Eiseniibacteriota bacterium TaxID=2212470 RepID=A0A948W4K7_UNCEI|nr:metal ABC transporter permease [Candidatus Eisenbacteria bacterium]MBU1948610.1 metal ABC transporter permease [Candidatus Eisenbacteria bacterium]MBU2692332.1 metal ABC transporter permease [Candidatus Eisenbacteria bacterium]